MVVFFCFKFKHFFVQCLCLLLWSLVIELNNFVIYSVIFDSYFSLSGFCLFCHFRDTLLLVIFSFIDILFIIGSKFFVFYFFYLFFNFTLVFLLEGILWYNFSSLQDFGCGLFGNVFTLFTFIACLHWMIYNIFCHYMLYLMYLI